MADTGAKSGVSLRSPKGRLSDFLQRRLDTALEELSRLSPDTILSENVDVLVAELLGRHMTTPIAVDWLTPSASPVQETTTQVRDHFEPDRTYTVPASKIVVKFPLSGSQEMLDYQASTFSLSGWPAATATQSQLVVDIVERTLNADEIRKHLDRVEHELGKHIQWANADLSAFEAAADASIRDALGKRRERIQNDRHVEQALGIPIRASDAMRPPVPARRKHIDLSTRTAQSGFVPEPLLEEANYEAILDTVASWAKSLERTPGTVSTLREEQLRDLLLGTLNGYWQGAAGGEMFNASGKTDILIRHQDRNAFIAECKIWSGPKGVGEALDQLLSYLVWRDSKTALIYFIRTSDPAATIDKLHQAVKAHNSHVLTKDSPNPSIRADYILTADEEGRRISLAVIPVVIPPTTSSEQT